MEGVEAYGGHDSTRTERITLMAEAHDSMSGTMKANKAIEMTAVADEPFALIIMGLSRARPRSNKG
jgi:hypothetical protein